MQQQAQETILWLLVPVPELVHMPVPVAVAVTVAAAGLVVRDEALGLQGEL